MTHLKNRKKKSVTENDFVFFSQIKSTQKRELLKNHKIKQGFKYFVFESPIGVHSRGLPTDFINSCLPYFKDKTHLYKSIEKAFTIFYGCNVKAVVSDTNEIDVYKTLQNNFKKPTRWSLCKNTSNENYIMASDLNPLFTGLLPSSVKTYIMIDHNTGYYKIGKSKNPKFREKTLQSEKPTIEIVKIFDVNIEKDLHKRYKEKRVRGEWFKLTKQDLLDIASDYSL